MRFPILQHTLGVIKQIDPDTCKTIIDIGAQRKTDFLMECFPKSFHHLFEPATVYHDDLMNNYAELNIPVKLHKIALSGVDSTLYLHNTSGDGSGRITHSYILDKKDQDMARLVNIEAIPSRRLDSVMSNEELTPYQFLVKLDVDGIEEQIISGGDKTIRNASFIIIEASVGKRNLFSRAALIEGMGFRLYDISDNAYYYGQLSQVDLVFINENVRNSNIKFRPWEYADWKVIWKNWQHGFPELEAMNIDNPFL